MTNFWITLTIIMKLIDITSLQIIIYSSLLYLNVILFSQMSSNFTYARQRDLPRAGVSDSSL